ncbi:septin-5 [Biomphalaria pfeifferi]|uniref:Septin n=1 Tax=Biomphalaria pfeifferi TaxID=112525 RepID=A0AAD8ASA8_BIOPF|nr:septin-5 [Biomphalaria pfeifferi]
METGRVSPMKPKRNTSKKNLVENVSEPLIGQNGLSTSPVSPSGNILDSVILATPGLKRRLTRRMIYTPAKYKDEDEYIGFATLPEQVHRKAVRKGFDFTLMVVGESGLGKSTVINSLFLSDLYKDRELPSVNDLVERTVNIEKKQLEIEEKGVRLKLTIVDTPGFNDAVNAGNSQKSLIEYVDKQFEQYYEDECGLNRRNIVDNRVHCCLYFISPYGHGLRQIDIETMKKLHHKVNIVPLLAKADILTKEELRRMKNRILQEIEENHIQIYEFPDCDSDEDEDFKQQDRELKASIPFAVVGCNTVVEAGGKKIRGRAYPWGIVEVDNPNHCDFIRLRQMLISTHMQDLKDVTSDVHYENYRALHIRTQLGSAQKERGKLKRDSAANFEALSDTEKLLEQKEAEIQRMQQMLAKMQEQLKASSPQQQHVNGLGKL